MARSRAATETRRLIMSVGSKVLDGSPASGVLSRAARGVRQLASSSLLQKSGLSVLDQAVVSGTSFATSVLLGRYASQSELGVYYLALSVVYFARGVQEQIVSAPYMIYCSRKDRTALAEYAGSSLIHQCIVMAATALLLVSALLAGLLPHGVE